MATATATRSRTTAPQGPRKRSSDRAAAVLVRMPELHRKLLQAAADRRGISINQLVLAELTPFFVRELEGLEPDPDNP